MIMDRKIEKKPWYYRYRYYLALGVCIIALIVYAITLSIGPKRMHIDRDYINIAEVKDGKFMEYVDVEGIVQPILTIKVNALESGFVDRIVAEDGSMLNAGDTILVLQNPELMRTIDDEEDEWQRQQRLYHEQAIEMEQKSLALQQQALDANYEMSNLDNKRKACSRRIPNGHAQQSRDRPGGKRIRIPQKENRACRCAALATTQPPLCSDARCCKATCRAPRPSATAPSTALQI